MCDEEGTLVAIVLDWMMMTNVDFCKSLYYLIILRKLDLVDDRVTYFVV